MKPCRLLLDANPATQVLQKRSVFYDATAEDAE